MIGLDKVGRINGGAVAESERPVLDGRNQWPPDAGGRRRLVSWVPGGGRIKGVGERRKRGT